MARVNTNNVSLQYAVEQSIGVLPGSPAWRVLEPNTLTSFGAAITTVSRRPISKDRGRKKGTVTDLNSTPEFEADLTLDAFTDFAEGFAFAEFANVEFDLKDAAAPPTPTATGYDIDAASALLAGKVQFTANVATLVYAKGYGTVANNGLKAITADLAPSGVGITVSGNTSEPSPPAKASLQVAGFRVISGDVTLTISGSTATLVSAAAITDWASLGIFPGMEIHVGSNDGSGAVLNAFDGTGTDDVFGYARVSSINGATLNLDKLDENLNSSPETNVGVLDVMIGRFVRNVQVTAAVDDNRFLERTYQLEAGYPDLDGATVDAYEYAIGNFANQLAMSIPLTDKASATWGFIGTNVDDITTTRKTGAATAVSPLRTVALNTSSNIASLTTDVVSLQSDVCFKSLTLTLLNNVSPEKCLGTLGAAFVNSGLFEVNLEGQMLFTRKEIVNAIKNNTTVTFQTILANEDGAISLDLPSLTFGDGNREFPVDQSVLVNITGETFTDPVLGHDIGITVFPSVPTIRP